MSQSTTDLDTKIESQISNMLPDSKRKPNMGKIILYAILLAVIVFVCLKLYSKHKSDTNTVKYTIDNSTLDWNFQTEVSQDGKSFYMTMPSTLAHEYSNGTATCPAKSLNSIAPIKAQVTETSYNLFNGVLGSYVNLLPLSHRPTVGGLENQEPKLDRALVWVPSVNGKAPQSAINWQIGTQKLGSKNYGYLTYDQDVIKLSTQGPSFNGASFLESWTAIPFALGASTVELNKVGVMDPMLWSEQVNFAEVCTNKFIGSLVNRIDSNFSFSLKPFQGIGAAPLVQTLGSALRYPSEPVPGQQARYNDTQGQGGGTVPIFEFRVSGSDPNNLTSTVFNISYTGADGQTLYLCTTAV